MTAMPAQAASRIQNDVDPYDAAVDEINDKYDTEISIGEFDHEKIGLDEFYMIIEEEAQRQAALEASIENRHFYTESLPTGTEAMPVATTKTATKNAWGTRTYIP